MANVGCCKYSMFIVNFLVFIGGICLLAVGIWVEVGATSFKKIISANPVIFDAVYVIIAVGCFLIIVGFLGCCGAIQENQCMLGTFFAVILVIFVVEIVGGILAFAYYNTAIDAALETMNRYNDTTEEGQKITEGWLLFQKSFNCCGINGYGDWIIHAPKVEVPPFPCEKSRNLPNRGCAEVLENYFWVLGGIAFAILVIEILAMIFTCCLYQNVKKEVHS